MQARIVIDVIAFMNRFSACSASFKGGVFWLWGGWYSQWLALIA